VQPNRIRSVLVATDLGNASDDVVGSAGRLARAAGASLHVIHAFDLALSVYPEVTAGAPTFQGRIEEAETLLAAQLARALAEGVQAASREIVIYQAHRAILARAADVRADVIVLGPHRGGGGAVLGTTADRVVRTALCPCLVVRAPLELPLWRVVVPTDLSEPARGALSTALAWAECLGAPSPDLPTSRVRLDLVHVMPCFFEAGDLPVSHAAIGPLLHQDVEAVLAGHGGGVDVREELVWGDGPAREIAAYAQREDAGLIVLGTHGHGILKRALIGSVASAVARTAPCPVLLVPPSGWSGADEVRESGEAASAA
jgi:nucleotide-binding universal stress UspA family protein